MAGQNQSSKISSIERRTFLKTAAAASTGPLIAHEAAAKSTQYGATPYTEVGIKYEIEDTLDQEKFSFLEIDEFINHYVSAEDKVLYFNERYLGESRSVLRSSAPVIRLKTFTGKSTSRSTSPTTTLPTSLGRSYRTTGALRLSEPYQPERLSVEMENGVAVVRSEGGKTEISQNTVATHELPSHEVTVEASEPIPGEDEPLDVLIDGEPAPASYRPTARRTWEETLRVTPKVKVHNYGKVDLVGVDTEFPEVIPADANHS